MNFPTLAVFARAPELGKVKTRLGAEIGPLPALTVYRALIAHTAALIARWNGPRMVVWDGNETQLAASPLGAFPRRRQVDGGLGSRLREACAALLADGASGVIAIGTDCPTLALSHLAGLASVLMAHDVVLGPAEDGGYWGIGVGNAAAVKACFVDDLPWSTNRLLAATLDRLDAAGLRHEKGAVLADLDDAADLESAENMGFRWHSPNSAPSRP